MNLKQRAFVTETSSRIMASLSSSERYQLYSDESLSKIAVSRAKALLEELKKQDSYHRE